MKSNDNYFRNKFKASLTVMSSFALIVLFQNCGQDGFQTKMIDQLDLASESENDQMDLPNDDLPEITDDNDIREITDIFDNPQNESNSNDSVDNSASNIITASSTGKVYYVSTLGNNSNPGTISKPFKSIAYAVSKMVAGDTTYVRGGVYNEANKFEFNNSGTASARIKLLNYPKEFPIIDLTTIKRITIVNKAGKLKPIGHITIEGFEIRNGVTALHLFGTHDLVIRRNWMNGNIAEGILGNGKNNLVDRNIMSNIGNFASCARGVIFRDGKSSVCNKAHAMYLRGSNWVITNNLIYEISGTGIQVAGYPYDMSEYYGEPAGTRPPEFPDPSYAGASNFLIANNTIAYANYGGGVMLWQSGAVNAKIINNIFYENKQTGSGAQGISFLNSGGGHQIRNNLCYAKAPGGTTCIGSAPGKYTSSGNIVNVDPQFVNPGTGKYVTGVMPTFRLTSKPNFKLKAGSPAINKGLTLSTIKFDFLGVARPRGGAYDIGAYEF